MGKRPGVGSRIIEGIEQAIAWARGDASRARPDAPTRVLLAVIAKQPEAVEDVLQKGGSRR